MPFLQNKNKDEKPKRRSTLSFLFNPNIGSDIKPMGEVIGMFVRIIAMLFAANGLFPKNHPAIANTKIKLTMGDVISTAYQGLSFTKEGIPKVILFIAVVGMLVFSALFAIFFLLSLFMGQAHAADSMFVPKNPDCELGTLWLDYMFLGDDINADPSCGTALGVANADYIQNAMKAALAFFSNGVLVLAGVILLYHLLFMIAETAHTGKPMGKANQIWAPIRLVLAIGLLVPIGEGGLNTGQYAVVQIAKWGSGLASNTWGMLMDKMADQNYDLKMPASYETAGMLKNLVSINACVIAINEMIALNKNLINDFSENEYKVEWNKTTTPCDQKDIGFDVCTTYLVNSKNNKISCGTVKLFNNPDSVKISSTSTTGVAPVTFAPSSAEQIILQPMFRAQYDTLTNLLDNAGKGGQLDEVAQRVLVKIQMAYRPEKLNYGGEDVPKDDDVTELAKFDEETYNLLEKLADYYQESVDKSTLDYRNIYKENFENFNSVWNKQGWVTAGTWFNAIARAQGAVFNGAEAGVPDIAPPKLFVWSLPVEDEKKDGLKNSFDEVTTALKRFEDAVLILPRGNKDFAAIGLPDIKDLKKGGTLLKGLMFIINEIALKMGIWKDDGKLAFEFGRTANPLAELAALGYANMEMGLTIITNAGAGITASAVASGFGGKISSSALTFLGSLGGAMLALVMMLGVLFITAGLAMAFVLPLIPYIKYFFNVMSWLLSVFGALVAMPLFALAHINPNGDGLPGPMAKNGYYFLLSLVLRPTLIVFGLFAGLLLFFVGINFLNSTFYTAVIGTGNASGSIAIVAKIVFSVMYAGLAYILATTCFSAISFFPETAMKWMGAEGAPSREMGDKGKLTTAMSVATAYMGEKMASSLTSIAGSPKEAIKDYKPSKNLPPNTHSSMGKTYGANTSQFAGTSSGGAIPSLIGGVVGAGAAGAVGSSSTGGGPQPSSGGPSAGGPNIGKGGGGSSFANQANITGGGTQLDRMMADGGDNMPEHGNINNMPEGDAGETSPKSIASSRTGRDSGGASASTGGGSGSGGGGDPLSDTQTLAKNSAPPRKNDPFAGGSAGESSVQKPKSGGDAGKPSGQKPKKDPDELA